MLVKCQKCGAKVSEFAEACPKCNASSAQFMGLVQPCFECGHRYAMAYSSCSNCGAPRLAKESEKVEGVNTEVLDLANSNAMSRTKPTDKAVAKDLTQEPTSQPKPADGRGALGIVVTVLIAFVAVAIFSVWGTEESFLSQPSGASEASPRAELENSLKSNPNFSGFLSLKDNFPYEYNELMEQLVELTSDSQPEEVEIQAATLMRQFVDDFGSWVALAPDEPILELITSELEVAKALKLKGYEYCSAQIRGDMRYASELGADPYISSLFLKSSNLTLIAMNEGKSASIKRRPLSDEEFQLLYELSVDPQTLERVTTTPMEEWTDKDHCDLSIQVFEYMSQLDDATAVRYYAGLVMLPQ